MKMNHILGGAFALLCLIFAASCNNDENKLVSNPKINQAVLAKYPTAKILDVDGEHYGYEVDLIVDGTKLDMFLDKQYNWLRSEYDIPWNAVPQAIKTSFAQEGYTFNTREDDADKIVYPEAENEKTFYRIDLDREPTDIIVEYWANGEKKI